MNFVVANYELLNGLSQGLTIDLYLTPSLGHFLFHCGTNDVHINHEAHLFVWSVEVI